MTSTQAATLIRHSHRQCYPPFHAPSLTCHLMLRFRNPEDSYSPAEDASDKTRHRDVQKLIDDSLDSRLKPINQFLRKTTNDPTAFFEARAHEEQPGRSKQKKKGTQDQTPPPVKGCHPGATLHFNATPFGHFAIGVIAEVNAEYVAISLRAWPLQANSPTVAQSTAQTTLNAYNALRSLWHGDVIPDTQADAASRALYGEFWDSYFCHLAGHDGTRVAPRTTLFVDPLDLVGEFQGLLFATEFSQKEPDANEDTDAHRLIRLEADAKTYEKLLSASERDVTASDRYDGAGPLMQFAGNENDYTKARLRHFVNDRQSFLSRIVGFRNSESRPFNPGNSVLGYVFGGLAIHGSTLGGDDSSVTGYYVVYGGPSRHQLGRLAMCLHHCGEMRLAGFFDWDCLDVASHRIRLLDQALGGFESTASGNNEKERARRMREYRAELDSIAKSCDGGLAFRISRAAYYADVIDRLLRDLRVKRIEGWQTYEGFVRRNILRHVNGLAAVGERFQVLQRRVRQIDNADTTLHLADHQAKLVGLQETAEFVAMVAFAYYGGTILGYIFHYLPLPLVHDWIIDLCTLTGAKCFTSETVSADAAKTTQAGVAAIMGYGVAFLVAVIPPLLRGLVRRK